MDDGLGDEPTIHWGYMPGSMLSSGLHLRQTGKGTQIGGLVSAGTVSPSATGSGPANVYVSVGVTQDTRGLTISRDNAINEMTDADGTVHGDTTYSYFDTEPSGRGTETNRFVPNLQTFHPNFQGGWSTKAVPVGNGVGSDYDANWSWSPDNSQDDLHNGLFSIGTGRMNRADGV